MSTTVLDGISRVQVFHCDAPDCTVERGEDEIIYSGGLKQMGWATAADKHYCPKHSTITKE